MNCNALRTGQWLLLLTLAFWPASAEAKRFRAATAEAATAAAHRAQPGDEIVLTDGEFNNLELALTAPGTRSQPLRLRAENPGKAILTGSPQLRIAGEFIEVGGLVFRGCAWAKATRGAVVFDGSADSLLTGCRFESCSLPHGAALVSFRNGAHDNRVATNCFLRTRYKAVMVVVDDTSLNAGRPVRNRIDHNLFQDVPRFKGNGAETIQVGQRAAPYSDLPTFTLIEDNEFVRCDGEAEIISLKTSGNVVRNNHFQKNTGEVVMRHGHTNVVSGNRFEGGLGGIRVSGHSHLITENLIANCRTTGIRLYYGTTDLNHPASYLPVFGCLISNNIISNCPKGILVGDHKNATLQDEKWAGPPWFANRVQHCTIAPSNNVIVSNTIAGKSGTMLQCIDAPNNVVKGNLFNGQQP